VHNWALLNALPELVATGIPVLVGASRKRFLGALLADSEGALRPPDGRETATAVISALAAQHGAWGVRVHDVRASVDALKVVEAWSGGRERSDLGDVRGGRERSDLGDVRGGRERSDLGDVRGV
jgi:dihydropteroate synthase